MLINNAGFGIESRFEDMSNLDLFEKVMQVNFFGGVYCTHYALPYLKKSMGRLVAVSSLRGKFPSARADGYGASKHAIVGFYGSLRNELFDSGVSVTIIYPGWVCTGITSRVLKLDGHQTGQISPHEERAMSVETCARMIIRAAEKRKRQLIMTFQGMYGEWLQLIAQRFVDRVTRKVT
jgi:short-subunit dehydrogenase